MSTDLNTIKSQLSSQLSAMGVDATTNLSDSVHGYNPNQILNIFGLDVANELEDLRVAELKKEFFMDWGLSESHNQKLFGAKQPCLYRGKEAIILDYTYSNQSHGELSNLAYLILLHDSHESKWVKYSTLKERVYHVGERGAVKALEEESKKNMLTTVRGTVKLKNGDLGQVEPNAQTTKGGISLTKVNTSRGAVWHVTSTL
jgi:hypothetical protein